MPKPTKTSKESLQQMFMQRYKLGMKLREIAKIHQVSIAHCSRLLKANMRCDVTRELLAQYRPSWVNRWRLFSEDNSKRN